MTDKTSQQMAVLWVVRAACIVFVGGGAVMAYMGIKGIAVPDQFDRLVNLAGVGALALLGRTSDTKQEAKEAAEKIVNDLAELAPAPQEVTVVNPPEAPVQTTEVAAVT